MSSRVHRSIMNMKVGMLFYFLSLFLAFYSRKIFLDCLGADFIGLTGALYNILSFLAVAELGIGTSITYFLYKPLQEDNHQKINDVMSMLAYLYRTIGLTIGAGGILISLFFPLMFKEQSMGLPIVYFAFYSFLASSVAGYVLNYRQLLVSANQQQYVVNAYFQTIAIVQSLVQIILAWYYQNLYLWVLVGLIFTVIGCIVFNKRISKVYPWLQIDMHKGKLLLKEYPDVLKKTRQIFIQKIKDFVLYRSDQILIFAFVSLKMVALYDSYMIIINKINYLVNILSNGMNAGIGNLIAEGNQKNTIKVFWELTAIRFIIIGLVIYPLFMFVQPFVACWLGSEYVLSDLVVCLLLFNMFIMLSRGVVEMYIGACGLFSDVWATWTELILNIGITLALAPFLGITGILIGKIASVFFIAIFWKPYFLFSKGLHQSVACYWRGMLPYYTIFAMFLVAALVLRQLVIIPHVDSFQNLIIYGMITFCPLILLYLITMFFMTDGTKYFVARKPQLYRRITFWKK